MLCPKNQRGTLTFQHVLDQNGASGDFFVDCECFIVRTDQGDAHDCLLCVCANKRREQTMLAPLRWVSCTRLLHSVSEAEMFGNRSHTVRPLVLC